MLTDEFWGAGQGAGQLVNSTGLFRTFCGRQKAPRERGLVVDFFWFLFGCGGPQPPTLYSSGFHLSVYRSEEVLRFSTIS